MFIWFIIFVNKTIYSVNIFFSFCIDLSKFLCAFNLYFKLLDNTQQSSNIYELTKYNNLISDKRKKNNLGRGNRKMYVNVRIGSINITMARDFYPQFLIF